MIELNGRPADAAGLTVRQLLEQSGAQATGVAVAVNGEVVPCSQHDAYVLRGGDVVEVVTAVQGG